MSATARMSEKSDAERLSEMAAGCLAMSNGNLVKAREQLLQALNGNSQLLMALVLRYGDAPTALLLETRRLQRPSTTTLVTPRPGGSGGRYIRTAVKEGRRRALSILDTLQIDGQPIGDMHPSDLRRVRRNGNVADILLKRRANHVETERVRDWCSASDVERAVQSAAQLEDRS